jgi:hypothetical protein
MSVRGARSFVAWLFAVGALAPAPLAHALSVVVVPLDAEGTRAFEAARLASGARSSALRELPELRVMESRAVSAELGVSLVEQVHLCRREVLCLVQIGDAVSADRMLLGELSEVGGQRLLKLYVVEVTKAAMIDTLTWTVSNDDAVLEDAVRAAMRQLFGQPDARIVLQILPRDAQLELFGERVNLRYWEEIPFWSGVYYGRVSAKGHEARDVRIVLAPGGPSNVVIELVPDLLYVDPDARSRKRDTDGKFMVVSAADAAAQAAAAAAVDRPSPLANPWAWGLVALGAGASAVGGAVVVGAQSDYNALSVEPRFLRGETTTAIEAIAAREDARDSFSLGSKVMVGGIVVGVAGLVWMLVDAAIDSGAPVAPASSGGR